MKRSNKNAACILWLIVCAALLVNTAGCASPKPIVNGAASIAEQGFAIAVNEDGTVRTVGKVPGDYSFSGWENIKSVSISYLNAGGLREDGTVMVTGSNRTGACDVEAWRNISMLELTAFTTFGLKKDGTVTYTGSGYDIDLMRGVMDEVDAWRDIVCIDTSQNAIAGLTKDGHVLVADTLQPELAEKVRDWEDMKSVGISTNMVMGLTNDGKVLIVQDNIGEMLSESDAMNAAADLTGAVKICCGQTFVAALMPDGTLRVRIIHNGTDWEEETMDLDGTEDVADIYSYDDYLTVLKKDGTVLMSGYIE